MSNTFMVYKTELFPPPTGTSTWLHGFKPGHFFYIYTEAEDKRVDDYPHFSLNKYKLEGYLPTQPFCFLTMLNYHYSPNNRAHYERTFNGIWKSRTLPGDRPPPPEVVALCEKFEALLIPQITGASASK